MADLSDGYHLADGPLHPPNPRDNPNNGNHAPGASSQHHDLHQDPQYLVPNYHPRLLPNGASHEHHAVQMPVPPPRPPHPDPNHRKCLRAREEWSRLRNEYDKVKTDFVAVNNAYIQAKREWRAVQARDSLMHPPDSRCPGAEAYYRSQQQIYRAAKRQYVVTFQPLRSEYRVRRYYCHEAWDRYKAHREVCSYYIAKKKVEDEKAKEEEEKKAEEERAKKEKAKKEKAKKGKTKKTKKN